MRKISLLGLAVLVAAPATQLSAQDFAVQTVSFEVQAINEIAVSGSPSLVINNATPGSAPDNALASGSWAITTNEVGKKVTASMDEAMPSGVLLKVTLAAPAGASSAQVTLGTSALDVVTGISTLNQSGLAISYVMSATSAAGVIAAADRDVTYTIVTGP